MKPIIVERMACARIPTELGEFQLCHYRNDSDEKEHLALVMGQVNNQADVLVRVHSECFTGDVLGSLRCDCGPQLQRAIALIAQAGRGVLIYLRQEGRGIGLLDKLRAYNLQDDGFDTVEANLILGHQPDSRDYTIASLILKDLGVTSIKLLTNNPEKIESLKRSGVPVSARIPLQTEITKENAAYLQTKVSRMQHMLDLKHLSTSVANNGHAQFGSASNKQTENSEDFPFITLSYAQSLDGSIAIRRGTPLAISGPESLRMTHKLRAKHDGILVGIGTVLADDPQLNVRLAQGVDPQPIILDSQLRFPKEAKLLRNPRKPWIVSTVNASRSRQIALENKGAQIIRLPSTADGMIDLDALLSHLWRSNIHSLMVEGGATVIQNFISGDLVDHLVVTISPTLVGGLKAFESNQLSTTSLLPRIRSPQVQKLGQDIVVSGYISKDNVDLQSVTNRSAIHEVDLR